MASRKNVNAMYRLTRLMKKTRAIGTPEFMAFMEPRFQRTVNKLIKIEFDGKFGPDGEAWPPRKKPREFHGRFRPERGELMRITKALQKGFKVSAEEGGICVRNSVRYAIYHQSREPRTILPRRAMIPDNTTGMGPAWADMFNDTMRKGVKAWVGKRSA